jgi:hypothetical protein
MAGCVLFIIRLAFIVLHILFRCSKYTAHQVRVNPYNGLGPCTRKAIIVVQINTVVTLSLYVKYFLSHLSQVPEVLILLVKGAHI